ncbi:MAG TPA: oligosaccharide flippase family protein [Phenylobacterium sp.]|uniref:oligosaccharide flippase family protein n=1 Tax=Phenylobacterium sp. TaxID=1871053 RepID=UPI002D6D88E5|nr:oligosaccharide flippase family protein [Phenylobacterium sp.]HZZ69128.1 oligosaccharide flippase family protein [Phenylobacterium sp.]
MTEQPASHPTRRQGARVYLAGSVLGQACALLRYTLLARLLGPTQLGLVATLVLVSQFFELISDTGGDRFLVQDAEGDTPEVQQLVQLVFVGRGLFMAAGLLLFAKPIANLYGQPVLFAGLGFLALSPLAAGFVHLDMRRVQRRHNFTPEGVGMLLSEPVGLIATLVAAFLTRNYTAILFGLITRAAVVTIISHLFAKRPYRLGYSPTVARRLAAFTAPLLANGVLLFVAGQSDRVVISRLVGLEDFGRYTAVLLLILYPTAALQRYIAAIHLPLLAATRSKVERGDPADLLGGRVVLIASAIVAGFACAAPILVILLYGHRFTQPAVLVGLIGVLQSARFIRFWPTTIAVGLGRSDIVLANNLARIIGLPAAFGGLALIGGVEGVLVGFILGEFAALMTAVFMVNRGRGTMLWTDFDRIAAFAISCGLTIASLAAIQYHWIAGLLLVPVIGVFLNWQVRKEWASLGPGIRWIRNRWERIA